MTTSFDSITRSEGRERRARLIYRALRNRTARASVAAGGVAISTVLVLVLMGAYRALTAGVRAYVGPPQIDLWVAPHGTDNLIRSSALLPTGVVDAIAALPSVSEAAPLLRGFVAASPGGGPDPKVSAAVTTGTAKADGSISLLAIGYRAPDGLGGPPRMITGKAPKGTLQVALDRAAADRLGVTLGEPVSINGRDFELVGLTGGTNLIATQFAFFDARAVEHTSGFSGHVSFAAVGLRPGAASDDVARQIRDRFPQAAVYTREAFVANNIREVAAGFRPMQLLVSGLGIVTAAALVALLVQAGVEDRRQDISVLLAMGAAAANIGVGIVRQVILLVTLGGGVGALLTLALHSVLRRWVPAVELVPQVQDLALALPLFIASSVVAASLPVLRLRRVDPIEAFRP